MSTMLLIGFSPIDINADFNHSGESVISTPSITTPIYLLHKSFDSISISKLSEILLEFLLYVWTFFSLDPVTAETSLATPYIPKQSGLFGVNSKSIMVSE